MQCLLLPPVHADSSIPSSALTTATQHKYIIIIIQEAQVQTECCTLRTVCKQYLRS